MNATTLPRAHHRPAPKEGAGPRSEGAGAAADAFGWTNSEDEEEEEAATTASWVDSRCGSPGSHHRLVGAGFFRLLLPLLVLLPAGAPTSTPALLPPPPPMPAPAVRWRRRGGDCWGLGGSGCGVPLTLPPPLPRSALRRTGMACPPPPPPPSPSSSSLPPHTLAETCPRAASELAAAAAASVGWTESETRSEAAAAESAVGATTSANAALGKEKTRLPSPGVAATAAPGPPAGVPADAAADAAAEAAVSAAAAAAAAVELEGAEEEDDVSTGEASGDEPSRGRSGSSGECPAPPPPPSDARQGVEALEGT